MHVRTNFPQLQPARDQAEFQIHCDALEWSLAEPIIIDREEDIKSRQTWEGRVQPYLHQVQNLIRFCRRLPVVLLADDVGLGKTISAGLILSELMARRRVSRCFVICPKILIDQWVEELATKFNIPAKGATGSELNRIRQSSYPVIATTYQSATKFLGSLEPGVFDMLILDEAHKVRNLFGTDSPPKIAKAVHGALSSRMFKYTLMLTATPIQNRLWDIYSLIDCLSVGRGHKNPFGEPVQFQSKFIEDQAGRRLRKESAAEFRNQIASYMFRTRRVDAQLAFPDRKVNTFPVRRIDPELAIENVIAENIDLFGALVLSSVLVAMMSSAQALSAQLENMADKNPVYRGVQVQVTRLANQVRLPSKMRQVFEIIEHLKGQHANWRMVIFTTRRETQRVIGELLIENGITCGFISGGNPGQNLNTISRFKQDPPGIQVIVSTDAGAEGVNLQVANILVNYDLPWNPMVVEQRIGRVQRIGSKFKSVWVANVVHRDSPEQNIVGRLMEKLQVIAHTVGDIEAVLESGENINDENFEIQIRNMVVAALKGQDVRRTAELAEQSIESGKKIFEEQREEIDRLLGVLGEENQGLASLPRLSTLKPRTEFRNFVFSGLEAGRRN